MVSKISGSSAGDLGELTPCNASPNLSAIMAFSPIATKHATEEAWRLHMQSLVSHVPTSPLHLFHLLHRVVKVRIHSLLLLLCPMFNVISLAMTS